MPPARFSRFARALFEPRPASFQKETPSFRMVFLFGAGDEARTRYLDLGKVALYQEVRDIAVQVEQEVLGAEEPTWQVEFYPNESAAGIIEILMKN